MVPLSLVQCDRSGHAEGGTIKETNEELSTSQEMSHFQDVQYTHRDGREA